MIFSLFASSVLLLLTAELALSQTVVRTCGDCTDFGDVGSSKWCRCCEVCGDMTPICIVNHGFCTSVCAASPTCATFVPRTSAPTPPPPTPAPPLVNEGPTPPTEPVVLPRTCGDCTDFQEVGSPFWCRCCEVCPDQTRTCIVNFGFCTSVCTAAATCATYRPTMAAEITVPTTASTTAPPATSPSPTVTPPTPIPAVVAGSSPSPATPPPVATPPTPTTSRLDKPTGYIVTFTTVKTPPPTWPPTTTLGAGAAGQTTTPRPTVSTPPPPTPKWRPIIATLGGVPGGAPTAASTTLANGLIETPPLAGDEVDDDKARDTGADVAVVLATVFGVLLFCIVLALAIYVYQVRVSFKKVEAKHGVELHEKDVELQHELQKEHEAEAQAALALTKEHLAEQKLEVLEAMTGISADDAQRVASSLGVGASKKIKKLAKKSAAEQFEDVELKTMESDDSDTKSDRFESPRRKAPLPPSAAIAAKTAVDSSTTSTGTSDESDESSSTTARLHKPEPQTMSRKRSTK